MLVGPEGEAVGSVSGGCVEGAVYELAQEVVESGTPVLQRYGVSDEDAFAVGLTCGGILDVFVETCRQETFPELGDVAADIEAGPAGRGGHGGRAPGSGPARPTAGRPRRRRTSRPERLARQPRLDDAVTDDARGLLAAGHSETLTYGPDGQRRGEGMRVFVDVHAPAPRMLVFGAIDFAAAVRPDRRVPRLPR